MDLTVSKKVLHKQQGVLHGNSSQYVSETFISKD